LEPEDGSTDQPDWAVEEKENDAVHYLSEVSPPVHCFRCYYSPAEPVRDSNQNDSKLSAASHLTHRTRAHRSTSPNTMSSEPSTADTSASMWPLHMKSIACRCAKPGARILHL